MSILIKGVEVPTDGSMIFAIRPDGMVEDVIMGCYVGKAVPVPPHLRLIDADALKEFEFCCLQADKKIIYQMGWNDAIEAIVENAPTVIPAEEGE